MPVTLKDLGNGQLPAAKATLYTCPVGKTAAGKITLVNTDAVARTFNIYVNKSGASRRVSSKDQSLDPGGMWVSGVRTLEVGDLIEGDASAATVVDYVIDGFEVS